MRLHDAPLRYSGLLLFFVLIFGLSPLYGQRIVSYDDLTPPADTTGVNFYSFGYGWLNDWQENNDDNDDFTGDLRYSWYGEYLVLEYLDLDTFFSRDFDLSSVDCNYDLEISFGYHASRLDWNESMDVFLYDSEGDEVFLRRVDRNANTDFNTFTQGTPIEFTIMLKDIPGLSTSDFDIELLQGIRLKHSLVGGEWTDGGSNFNRPIVKVDNVVLTAYNEVAVLSAPSDVLAFVGDNVVFSVTTENVDTYQWQESVDDGVTWVDIDGSVNSSAITDTLLISDVQVAPVNVRYRVLVSNSASPCIPEMSAQALLDVRVGTVITNRTKTYRVNSGG